MVHLKTSQPARFTRKGALFLAEAELQQAMEFDNEESIPLLALQESNNNDEQPESNEDNLQLASLRSIIYPKDQLANINTTSRNLENGHKHCLISATSKMVLIILARTVRSFASIGLL